MNIRSFLLSLFSSHAPVSRYPMFKPARVDSTGPTRSRGKNRAGQKRGRNRVKK